MKSLWCDREAAEYKTDLGLRVYTSRLLGRDPSLVLHGGGNTSVKIREKNIVGEEEEILYVKGSGWDLETIAEAGFAPVRMLHLLKLAKLQVLSDSQMVNELKTQMTKASAPAPSVETILHASLPYKFVDHTHADAVISVTNTANGWERIQEIYGDDVVIIPYVMPGFDLARVCAEKFAAEKSDRTIGMVLMNHGIFSFGETAQESYERMIALVDRAEDYLKKHDAWEISPPNSLIRESDARSEIAKLRAEVAEVAGFPVILSSHMDGQNLAFAQREDVKIVSQQGCATPDHVIRTKRLPLVGRDVKAYAEFYRAYFAEEVSKSAQPVTILDPAPRVILDYKLGLVTVGKSAKDAKIVADIYEHTMEIIQRSQLLGGYQALPASDIFAVEYWELEQAKLKKGGSSPAFTGEIALVTGAASGIGKACVESLLKRGAAVVGLDINPAIDKLYDRPDFVGVTCDVSNESAIAHALDQAVIAFGGLDILILNAGIFPSGCRIENLDTATWQKVMNINLDANLVLMREAYPLLKLAPKGGRVVAIGSKNVPAPGPAAAAYSASKAALTQLMRVAALEWSKDRIRINTLHPNAVFDTGIWTEEVLAARAQHYGLTIEEYKTNNLLRVEITSHHVAELAAEMCGTLFACTTAAQVPIDGGNDRVI
ncbi:MAG: bifunctional aldolase/short-chain dehydrogenase [Pseudanabaena sp.]|jgi:rhamnose utilization protein RhaD (predicted bifunctional aldolase and dehydrogenase)/NAD(P)-dependent dehydrogenase (short-subunit alcohol dehydrogenase family)|uniref:bifunctional aldolase/short-chain dehydrogenase n=1 Tax=Pseudanabaena mucicola TaxID=71190 RepID=UPI002576A11E|nr:bifunctional aldolase/short-chain dehydrogenase [Pseudanabaena mucicola]MCA6587199.1 bifunctional aldolase/short-chain dehydrogenase [Pseudanabaena sp. M051S1SP1A06QC]